MIKYIDQLDIESKKVFIRVDFNVPIEGGAVTDNTRIREVLPTIRHAIKMKCRVILASHLGRPKGKPDKKYSMEPVGLELARLLDMDIILADDCVGDSVRKVVSDLYSGKVALLENLRFHPEEEKNDEKFAHQLALLADVYINDAFGASHRAHASISAITRYVKNKGAGFLMKKEIEALSRLLGGFERPFVAIVGGAKISDKIGVLQNIIKKVDTLLIGGAMANTFLAGLGFNVGKSLYEQQSKNVARNLMDEAAKNGVKVLIPEDVVVSDSPENENFEVVRKDKIPDGKMVLDIGAETISAFKKEIDRAKTIFWNGPMGFFEKEPFERGTKEIANAVSGALAFRVAGGGDTVAAITKMGMKMRFDHVSTGGGASLEFLEGKKLPGIIALEE